jgi:ubiquinone/menaquinone biosynthesis C-methylase UbiE
MEYDRTNIPEIYNRGRDHGPEFREQWMTVIAQYIDASETRVILDLGCGTGRFSAALAARFNASLIGIDPSTKMLGQAVNGVRDGRVFFANGVAEALPLRANSVDMIFISMAFHHLADPHAAAAECRRVLQPRGRVLLRTACAERTSLYPYVPFFPATRSLLEERLPSLSFQRGVFEAESFQTISSDVVTQQIASDHSAYADKLATKADSILASLDDHEFQAGLEAMRRHAMTTIARPVTEPIDLIVFAKV